MVLVHDIFTDMSMDALDPLVATITVSASIPKQIVEHADPYSWGLVVRTAIAVMA